MDEQGDEAAKGNRTGHVWEKGPNTGKEKEGGVGNQDPSKAPRPF